MSLTLVSSSEDDIGSAPTTKLSIPRPHPGKEVMNSAMEEVVVCEAWVIWFRDSQNARYKIYGGKR